MTHKEYATSMKRKILHSDDKETPHKQDSAEKASARLEEQLEELFALFSEGDDETENEENNDENDTS